MFRKPIAIPFALLLSCLSAVTPAWADDGSWFDRAEPAQSEGNASGAAATRAPSDDAAAAPAAPAAKTPRNERRAPDDSSPPTLLGHSGKPAVGGYGGVSVLGTRVNHVAGVLVGGDAAVLVDHRLALGFTGMGLASDVQGPAGTDGKPARLQFGYGGVFIEANLVGTSPVYLAVGGMVGAAGTAFCAYGEHHWQVECNEATLDESVMFVAEPRIGIRANVVHWLRLGADIRYRFVDGETTRGLDDSDFAGPSVGGSIEFGWF